MAKVGNYVLPVIAQGTSMTWFEKVFGCTEAQARTSITHDHGYLVCPNGNRFYIGEFSTPTIGQLKMQIRPGTNPALASLGAMTYEHIQGDIGALIRNGASHAVYQAASQINCLEMISPSVAPSDGITMYSNDLTQGPICALACPFATFYRNYLVPIAAGLVAEQARATSVGQCSGEQIDLLAGISTVLGLTQKPYRNQNGYAFFNSLADFTATMDTIRRAGEFNVINAMAVGVQWDTTAWPVPLGADPNLYKGEDLKTVTHVYTSAFPVAYHPNIGTYNFNQFAQMMLAAAFEGTLLAAAYRAMTLRKRITVFLTQPGGGAFGNEDAWIVEATRTALNRYSNLPLDVKNVFYRSAPAFNSLLGALPTPQLTFVTPPQPQPVVEVAKQPNALTYEFDAESFAAVNALRPEILHQVTQVDSEIHPTFVGAGMDAATMRFPQVLTLFVSAMKEFNDLGENKVKGLKFGELTNGECVCMTKHYLAKASNEPQPMQEYIFEVLTQVMHMEEAAATKKTIELYANGNSEHQCYCPYLHLVQFWLYSQEFRGINLLFDYDDERRLDVNRHPCFGTVTTEQALTCEFIVLSVLHHVVTYHSTTDVVFYTASLSEKSDEDCVRHVLSALYSKICTLIRPESRQVLPSKFIYAHTQV